MDCDIVCDENKEESKCVVALFTEELVTERIEEVDSGVHNKMVEEDIDGEAVTLDIKTEEETKSDHTDEEREEVDSTNEETGDEVAAKVDNE